MERREIVSLILIVIGLVFFVGSVYLMVLAQALASLLAAAIGFAIVSVGVDLYKEAARA